MKNNIAESVRARLLNIAKKEDSDFETVLIRFILERFLYRLSQSEYAQKFLLKGAMLFSLWYDMPHRPTRDVDLLGFGDNELTTMEHIFQTICGIDYDDGVTFDSNTVMAEPIRESSGYTGIRVTFRAELARAKSKVQIDIGFGDVVTPGPVHSQYPVIIDDFPAPQLNTYPVYTVIAEKLHAIVLLGMANSRMKDYLDLMVLFEKEQLNNELLAQSVAATFKRRGMDMPNGMPVGLTNEFANDAAKQTQWRAFLNRNQMEQQSLFRVVQKLRENFTPILNGLEV